MPIRTKEEARAWRAQLNLILPSLPDKEASVCPSLFTGMRYNGELIEAGTRINWGGVLKVASNDLWDTENNNPENAPTLWEDLSYKDGIRIIVAPITSTNPFSLNELGWWGDDIYKSLQNNNVYTPDEYPPFWEKQ